MNDALWTAGGIRGYLGGTVGGGGLVKVWGYNRRIEDNASIDRHQQPQLFKDRKVYIKQITSYSQKIEQEAPNCPH